MAEEISGAVLCAIDKQSPTSLNEFLLTLSKSPAPISLEDVQQLAYSYTEQTVVDQVITLYKNAYITH